MEEFVLPRMFHSFIFHTIGIILYESKIGTLKDPLDFVIDLRVLCLKMTKKAFKMTILMQQNMINCFQFIGTNWNNTKIFIGNNKNGRPL